MDSLCFYFKCQHWRGCRAINAWKRWPVLESIVLMLRSDPAILPHRLQIVPTYERRLSAFLLHARTTTTPYISCYSPARENKLCQMANLSPRFLSFSCAEATSQRGHPTIEPSQDWSSQNAAAPCLHSRKKLRYSDVMWLEGCSGIGVGWRKSGLKKALERRTFDRSCVIGYIQDS